MNTRIVVGSQRKGTLNPPLGAVQIRIDRASVLGNPFDMGQDEALRPAVVEAHSEWLGALLANPYLDAVQMAVQMAQQRRLKIASAWKRPSTRAIIVALYELARQARSQEVWIMCWCAPSACHGDAYIKALRLGAVERAYRMLYPDQAELREPSTTGVCGKRMGNATGNAVGNRSVNATPSQIAHLLLHQVFVFGTNTEGRHGKGAALTAFGQGYPRVKGSVGRWAVYGQSRGMMQGREGMSYGICTKDLSQGLRSVALAEIAVQIGELIVCAMQHPDLEFLVTPFGTGLGGYSHSEMAQLWRSREIPANLRLPQIWLDLL